MTQRISGQNFDINLEDTQVHVSKATLTINDASTVAKTRGVPDGYVSGEVDASGELEVDTVNFNLICDQARKAGSWRGLKPFDVQFYAKAGKTELKVEAFGCKVKISDLLDIDGKGGDKALHKLPFDITDSDFIKINGVSYLSDEDVRDLLDG